MKFEWEEINKVGSQSLGGMETLTYRGKVPEGWIILVLMGNYKAFEFNTNFIFDPKHEWELTK